MLSDSKRLTRAQQPSMAEFRRPDGDRALPRLMELVPVGRSPLQWALKREKGVGKSRTDPSGTGGEGGRSGAEEFVGLGIFFFNTKTSF